MDDKLRECLAATLAILTKLDHLKIEEVEIAAKEEGFNGVFNLLSNKHNELFGKSLGDDEK